MAIYLKKNTLRNRKSFDIFCKKSFLIFSTFQWKAFIGMSLNDKSTIAFQIPNLIEASMKLKFIKLRKTIVFLKLTDQTIVWVINYIVN